MKIKLLSLTALLFLSACGNDPQEQTKNKTVLDNDIKAVKLAKETVEQVNQKTQTTQEEVAAVTEVAPKSGADLYQQKCASCHGIDAKKSALNTSAVIAGWTTTKIQKALHGYKDGSFGGKMKGIMQGQSKPLSDLDIKLLSDYISIL